MVGTKPILRREMRVADFVYTWGVAIAIAAVFVVLCFGLYTLFKSGMPARNLSNKLMRLRVLMQFIALLVMLGALYLKAKA